jgi:hypothetical protein
MYYQMYLFQDKLFYSFGFLFCSRVCHKQRWLSFSPSWDCLSHVLDFYLIEGKYMYYVMGRSYYEHEIVCLPLLSQGFKQVCWYLLILKYLT